MKKYGPFHAEQIEGVNFPQPTRNYDCANYDTCLSIAGGLDWDDFTCRGCVGEVNQSLYWQIRQAQRKDSLVKEICEVPGAVLVQRDSSEVPSEGNERELESQESNLELDKETASGSK